MRQRTFVVGWTKEKVASGLYPQMWFCFFSEPMGCKNFISFIKRGELQTSMGKSKVKLVKFARNMRDSGSLLRSWV